MGRPVAVLSQAYFSDHAVVIFSVATAIMRMMVIAGNRTPLGLVLRPTKYAVTFALNAILQYHRALQLSTLPLTSITMDS